MSYNPKTTHLPYTDTSTPFRSAFSPKFSCAITFPPDSPYTKQEFKDECDINILLAQYQTTGHIPNLNELDPQYLDVTGLDFQEHMQFIAGAQSLFNELPSSIRNRFKNDPGEFLDFTSNPANREEMAEMGLLKPQSEWVAVPPSQTQTPPPAANQVPSTTILNPPPPE